MLNITRHRNPIQDPNEVLRPIIDNTEEGNNYEKHQNVNRENDTITNNGPYLPVSETLKEDDIFLHIFEDHSGVTEEDPVVIQEDH